MSDTRIALVSGANRGIGLEIVRQLSREGIMTALGARDLEAGQKAADTLASEGLEPAPVALDVTDPESVKQAVERTIHLFGRIDILVNNAGILIDPELDEGGSVAETPIEIVQQTFEVNTLGPLRLMQAVLPHMTEARYGRIVNMSSGLGQLSDMGGGRLAYRLSKTALNALTRTAAAEVTGGDIKINAMCPGWVRTDMGGPNAALSVEEGAQTAVWLSMLDGDGPSGGFFRGEMPIPW
ncbi:MAG: SDR family oxidoreductase [Pseudomonadota bacterium]